MRTPDEAERERLEAYSIDRQPAPPTIDPTAHDIAHLARNAEAALSNDLLIKIGRSANNGEFAMLATAMAQMQTTIANGYQCSPGEARLVMIYVMTHPEQIAPMAPRLATSAERKRVAQAERAKSGKPKKNNG